MGAVAVGTLRQGHAAATLTTRVTEPRPAHLKGARRRRMQQVAARFPLPTAAALHKSEPPARQLRASYATLRPCVLLKVGRREGGGQLAHEWSRSMAGADMQDGPRRRRSLGAAARASERVKRKLHAPLGGRMQIRRCATLAGGCRCGGAARARGALGRAGRMLAGDVKLVPWPASRIFARFLCKETRADTKGEPVRLAPPAWWGGPAWQPLQGAGDILVSWAGPMAHFRVQSGAWNVGLAWAKPINPRCRPRLADNATCRPAVAVAELRVPNRVAPV